MTIAAMSRLVAPPGKYSQAPFSRRAGCGRKWYDGWRPSRFLWGTIMTRFPRRQFLRLAAGCGGAAGTPANAHAQAYPTRPVRILPAFRPAARPDIIARLIGQWLQERLGQPFIIENRPGAGGNLATEAAVRAPADGYTLLLVSSSHAINATLYDNLKFSVLRDIAPIASIVSVPNVMVVNPAVPAKTVPEFIAYAKANAGKLNMASAGNGTLEPSRRRAVQRDDRRQDGPRAVSRAGARADRSARRTGAGELRPDAAERRAYPGRQAACPRGDERDALGGIAGHSDCGESLPGYEAGTWAGLGAPKNTPAEIIDRINNEINAGLADPKVRAGLADIGGIVLPGSPDDAARVLAEETVKWAKVVKFAGLKPE